MSQKPDYVRPIPGSLNMKYPSPEDELPKNPSYTVEDLEKDRLRRYSSAGIARNIMKDGPAEFKVLGDTYIKDEEGRYYSLRLRKAQEYIINKCDMNKPPEMWYLSTRICCLLIVICCLYNICWFYYRYTYIA